MEPFIARFGIAQPSQNTEIPAYDPKLEMCVGTMDSSSGVSLLTRTTLTEQKVDPTRDEPTDR